MENLIVVNGDPSPEEALYIYRFRDGDIRYSNEIPSAVIEGMMWGKTLRKIEMDRKVLESEKIQELSPQEIVLPQPFDIPIDTEVARLRSAEEGLHGAFKHAQEITKVSEDFLRYVRNLSVEDLHIRFQVIAKLEDKVRALFNQYNIIIPDWWRPVNSGSRGGSTIQYGALGEVWFPAPNNISILPEGFRIIGGQARCSILSFAISMMLLNFPITDGPHKKN